MVACIKGKIGIITRESAEYPMIESTQCTEMKLVLKNWEGIVVYMPYQAKKPIIS